MIASPDSEPSSPSGTSRATPVRQLAPVRRRWPRSSGRRRWHGRHDAPHSLNAVHSLPSPLSRSLWRKYRRHCRRELRKLFVPSPLCLASPPSASKSASSSSIFSTHRLDEISPRLSTFCEFRVVGFTAVVTPISANFAAAPSLLAFFLLSRVKVGLGIDVGPRHSIAAEAPPSRGNTAAAPPCSPPTSTSHVSRLTGAVRVRRFHLESSALTHRCLSPFPRRSTGRRWPA